MFLFNVQTNNWPFKFDVFDSSTKKRRYQNLGLQEKMSWNSGQAIPENWFIIFFSDQYCVSNFHMIVMF